MCHPLRIRPSSTPDFRLRPASTQTRITPPLPPPPPPPPAPSPPEPPPFPPLPPGGGFPPCLS